MERYYEDMGGGGAVFASGFDGLMDSLALESSLSLPFTSNAQP